MEILGQKPKELSIKSTVSHIGKKAYEGQKKQTEHVNVIDLQREMTKRLPQLFDETIAKHKSYADEYYLILENQKFRHIPNAIRQFLIVRKTQPDATYDRSVWHYDNKSEKLTYLYTIPDKETVEKMYSERHSIPEEQKQLLQFVIDFKEGRLL